MELADHIGSLRVSSLYRTEPVGGVVQDDFLNSVACGEYAGSPQELLAVCNDVERRAGRNRNNEVRFGPRSLDLDVLLFNNSVIDSEMLTVPHPRMRERRFVLVPLLELAPECVDPETGRAFSSYLEQLSSQGIYYHRSPKLYF